MPRRKKSKEKETKVAFVYSRSARNKLLQDTTWIEEYHVFRASEKLGKFFSILTAVVGASFSLLLLYCVVNPSQLLLSNPSFIALLGFFGGINLVWGLILLAKD